MRFHIRSLFGRDVARKAFQRTLEDDNPKLRWPVKRRGGWKWHWHDLRHRSAVHHLDTLRLPVSDAATLLGHTEKTLMTRYYGSVDGVLERALAAYNPRLPLWRNDGADGLQVHSLEAVRDRHRHPPRHYALPAMSAIARDSSATHRAELLTAVAPCTAPQMVCV